MSTGDVTTTTLPNVYTTVSSYGNNSTATRSTLSLTVKVAIGVGVPLGFGLCVVGALLLSELLRLCLLRRKRRREDKSQRKEKLFLPDSIPPHTAGANEILGSPVAELEGQVKRSELATDKTDVQEGNKGPFELEGDPVDDGKHKTLETMEVVPEREQEQYGGSEPLQSSD